MANELQIFKGDDKTFLLTITGGGNANWTIVFTIKKKVDDTTVVITKTSANPGEIDNVSPTTWNINMVPADTNAASNVKAGQYHYDVEATTDDPQPLKHTLAVSTIQIDQEVTN